jgi:hypothetical protein
MERYGFERMTNGCMNYDVVHVRKDLEDVMKIVNVVIGTKETPSPIHFTFPL